jgi:LPS export ABC transporter protein LptC
VRLTRKSSFLLVAAVFVAFFGVAIGLMRGRPSSFPQPPASSASPSQEVPPAVGTFNASGGFTLNEFHRTQIKDGRTVWEVFGTEGQYFPAENRAVVKNARLTLSRNPDEDIKIKADTASLQLVGTELTMAKLTGHVVLKNKDQATMETEEAEFERATNTVTAPGTVRIIHPAAEVVGSGMVGNVDSQEFMIQHDVQTTLKARGEQLQKEKNP